MKQIHNFSYVFNTWDFFQLPLFREAQLWYYIFHLEKLSIPKGLTFLLLAHSTLKKSDEAFAISKQSKKISTFSKTSPAPWAVRFCLNSTPWDFFQWSQPLNQYFKNNLSVK